MRVVDGDTVDVDLGGRTARIRLANIDTPEKSDLARCERERQLGRQATAVAAALLPAGTIVELTYVPGHDPHGRTLARITARGVDFESEMLRRGLARAYGGHGPKSDWCR